MATSFDPAPIEGFEDDAEDCGLEPDPAVFVDYAEQLDAGAAFARSDDEPVS